jgi:hypothetical protein
MSAVAKGVATVPFCAVGFAGGVVVGTFVFLYGVFPIKCGPDMYGIGISVNPMLPVAYGAKGCGGAFKILWQK